MNPRYPVYIPSKRRANNCLTAEYFIEDKLPFYLVVEPQEAHIYATKFGEERLLILPENDHTDENGNPDGLIYVRNWIKGHATANGHKRHWQVDDNCRGVWRVYKGKRIRCPAGVGFRATEDLVDRYTNVAISGLNYYAFAFGQKQPFIVNAHVYSCTLILNSISNRWRLRYNDDTDMCLQVLADGWCTILMNAFTIHKQQTMTMKGGNTDQLYINDGRLDMARSLERMWPNVVETKRRWGRPQHVIKNQWGKFDTPLIRRTDIDFDNLPNNEYGLSLQQIAPEIKSKKLQKLVSEYGQQ